MQVFGCGKTGCGTVFALYPPSTPGGPWTEQVIHNFQGGTVEGGGDGANPTSGVIFDENGVLYGTTTAGGAGNSGTVYQMRPPAEPGGAWTERVIYNIGAAFDAPYARPVLGKGGVLYGVTIQGQVYSLTPPATSGGDWTYQTIASVSPLTGPTTVLIARDGVLYGTASYDGSECPCGSVYSVTQGADGAWTLKVIYTFESPADGYSPHYLASGPGGILYGTTDHGPATCENFCGTIFSLTPPAQPDGAWTEQLLYAFEQLSEPPDSLQVIGSNGALLGALIGDDEGGLVFLLDPPATPGGAWSEQVMHGFTGGTDGGNPMSAIASGGVIYGTTFGGFSGIPGGTVFQIIP
jgi:uncharacterized repeat protein (TIGR03803 family)